MAGTLTPKQFSARMFRSAKELREANFSNEMGKCHKIITQSINDNFSGTKAPDGSPWEPRKHDYPHPPLQKSGALLASSTKKGSKGAIWKTTKNSLKRGSRLKYAGYQHFGIKKKLVTYSRTSIEHGTRKFKRTLSIASRKFMGISAKALEECEELIRSKVRKMLQPR